MPVIPLPSAVLPPGVDGFCGWTVDPTDLCADWATYSVAVQDAALQFATLTLWAATGRQFGPCSVTIRPCQTKEAAQQYRAYPVPSFTGFGGNDSTWGPYIDGDGTWRNCGCGPSCCCRPSCEIVLRGPVASITEIEVDGVLVASSAYRVDKAEGAFRLVRTDGMCWPTCQDFDAAAGETGSFTVEYTIGRLVPQSVLNAVSLLACEIAKGLNGGACGLPSRVQSLTRQGVTVEMANIDAAVAMFQSGITTGNDLVDRVIRIFNPTGRTRNWVIMSPDMPEGGDRITTIGS